MRLAKKLLTSVLSFGVILMIPLSAHAEEADSNPNARAVPHYTYSGEAGETGEGEKGDIWDGEHYYLADGTLVRDAFFCDGEHTFYLQYDGTPMTHRLTYHPDGEHIIYFDQNGWEVFNDFAFVEENMEGEEVDDVCFFDTYGYMYVDRMTWGPSESYFAFNQDESGLVSHAPDIFGNPRDYSSVQFYVSPYGNINCGGLFTFPDGSVGLSEFYTLAWNKVVTSYNEYEMKDGKVVSFKTITLDDPMYFDAEGKYNYEKSQKYKACDDEQIRIINEYLGSLFWNATGKNSNDIDSGYMPNADEGLRFQLRAYNHAISEGKSEIEAELYYYGWEQSVNQNDNSFFYIARGSKEDFEASAVSYFGDWILDPYWEYGLLD